MPIRIFTMTFISLGGVLTVAQFEMKFNMFEDESLTGNPAFPADLKSGLTKSADVLLSSPDCS